MYRLIRVKRNATRKLFLLSCSVALLAALFVWDTVFPYKGGGNLFFLPPPHILVYIKHKTFKCLHSSNFVFLVLTFQLKTFVLLPFLCLS